MLVPRWFGDRGGTGLLIGRDHPRRWPVQPLFFLLTIDPCHSLAGTHRAARGTAHASLHAPALTDHTRQMYRISGAKRADRPRLNIRPTIMSINENANCRRLYHDIGPTDGVRFIVLWVTSGTPDKPPSRSNRTPRRSERSWNLVRSVS